MQPNGLDHSTRIRVACLERQVQGEKLLEELRTEDPIEGTGFSDQDIDSLIAEVELADAPQFLAHAFEARVPAAMLALAEREPRAVEWRA